MDFVAKYWIEAAFAAVVALLSGVIKKMSDRIKEERASSKAVQGGMMVMLKDRLTQSYHYHICNDFISPGELGTWVEMYKWYKELGGNGGMEALRRDIEDLPIRNLTREVARMGRG